MGRETRSPPDDSVIDVVGKAISLALSFLTSASSWKCYNLMEGHYSLNCQLRIFSCSAEIVSYHGDSPGSC